MDITIKELEEIAIERNVPVYVIIDEIIKKEVDNLEETKK